MSVRSSGSEPHRPKGGDDLLRIGLQRIALAGEGGGPPPHLLPQGGVGHRPADGPLPLGITARSEAGLAIFWMIVAFEPSGVATGGMPRAMYWTS